MFGNDYILHYNKKNFFIKREHIHESIVKLPFKSNNPGKKLTTTTHSHILSEYITPTDIFTLLSNKQKVEWEKHVVISKKSVSVFDMETETLEIMSLKEWQKMHKR